jgi:hypothetical protein
MHATGAALVLVTCCAFVWVLLHFSLRIPPEITDVHAIVTSNPRLGLTIRVNTFRRMDLIEGFLGYYTAAKRKETCSFIKEITVVWSDTDSAPPVDLLEKYNAKVENGKAGRIPDSETSTSTSTSRVVFEVHDRNSLNNRFLPLQQPSTEAVLSIDDDLIIPCEELARNLIVWSSFPHSLVGYSPRMHAQDATTGKMRYLRWQHTWWSGVYSIVLTKASFMHRDSLREFGAKVPDVFRQHVDKVRNCEDLAMALTVARQTRAAPVWIDGIVYEVSGQNVGGISSGGRHFDTRSECLEVLRGLPLSLPLSLPESGSDGSTGLDAALPWVTGYQKVVSLSLLDIL